MAKRRNGRRASGRSAKKVAGRTGKMEKQNCGNDSEISDSDEDITVTDPCISLAPEKEIAVSASPEAAHAHINHSEHDNVKSVVPPLDVFREPPEEAPLNQVLGSQKSQEVREKSRAASLLDLPHEGQSCKSNIMTAIDTTVPLNTKEVSNSLPAFANTDPNTANHESGPVDRICPSEASDGPASFIAQAMSVLHDVPGDKTDLPGIGQSIIEICASQSSAAPISDAAQAAVIAPIDTGVNQTSSVDNNADREARYLSSRQNQNEADQSGVANASSSAPRVSSIAEEPTDHRSELPAVTPFKEKIRFELFAESDSTDHVERSAGVPLNSECTPLHPVRDSGDLDVSDHISPSKAIPPWKLLSQDLAACGCHSTIEDLANQIVKLTSHNDRLRKSNKNLMQKVVRATAAIASLEALLAKTQKENEELSGDVSAVKEEKKLQVSSMRDQVHKLRASRDTLQVSEEALIKEQGKLRKEKDGAFKDAADFKLAASDAQQKVKALEATIQSCQTTERILVNEISTLKQGNTSLMSQLSASETRASVLYKELEKLKAAALKSNGVLSKSASPHTFMQQGFYD